MFKLEFIESVDLIQRVDQVKAVLIVEFVDLSKNKKKKQSYFILKNSY